MNLGYACINTGLSANKVMTNRTMRRKTFDAQGIDYVSDLSLKQLFSGTTKWVLNYFAYQAKYSPGPMSMILKI